MAARKVVIGTMQVDVGEPDIDNDLLGSTTVRVLRLRIGNAFKNGQEGSN